VRLRWICEVSACNREQRVFDDFDAFGDRAAVSVQATGASVP
jgi:hypothetical protein